MVRFGSLLCPLGLALLASLAFAEEGPPISFKGDIAPLLNRRCATCHNEETPKGRYRLDTWAGLLKPGESDAASLTPGQPEHSELFRLLVEEDPHDRMPQKADPLPAAEIGLIRRWITEGAHFDGGAPTRPLVEMARESFLRPAPEHYGRSVPITALTFSPDGSQIAASGYGEVTIWSVVDGSLVRRIGGLPERITALAWHPKKNLLAVAGGTPAQWGTVALIEMGLPGGRVQLLCDLPETSLTVAFSPDGTRLAAGSGDRTIRLFETKDGKPAGIFRQHADWVQSVAFSPDGTKLVSASRDRTVRVLDARTGEIEGTYTTHDAPLLQAMFNSRGDAILSMAAHAQTIHYWKLVPPYKPELLPLESETGAFALFGPGIVTTTPDNRVCLTQLRDKQPLFAMTGHRDTVQAIAVAPNMSALATGGYNGEILLWNFACGTWQQRIMARP